MRDVSSLIKVFTADFDDPLDLVHHVFARISSPLFRRDGASLARKTITPRTRSAPRINDNNFRFKLTAGPYRPARSAPKFHVSHAGPHGGFWDTTLRDSRRVGRGAGAGGGRGGGGTRGRRGDSNLHP